MLCRRARSRLAAISAGAEQRTAANPLWVLPSACREPVYPRPEVDEAEVHGLLQFVGTITDEYPSDANQTARLVAEMADRPGISYLRTLRGKTLVRTPPDQDVQIGGSRVVRTTGRDDITLVACGITVEEADKAAGLLESAGIRSRVIDCYSIKPLDAATLATAARETRGIVTVEDHWAEGGLGEAVLSALAGHAQPPVRILAVRDMPISGSAAELLHAAGIDAEAIVTAAHELLDERARAAAEPARSS